MQALRLIKPDRTTEPRSELPDPDSVPNTTRGRIGELLCLADLLSRGYQAFQTAEGMPYDIVFQGRSRLVKLQVKSTRGLILRMKLCRNPTYNFNIKRAKSGNRSYEVGEFDGLAFVTLDTKAVYYKSYSVKVANTCIFRSKDVQYHPFARRDRALFIQDFTLERFLREIGESYE